MTQSAIKILLISGSTRQGSLNTRLVEEAGRCAVRLGVGATTWVGLRDLALPVFDAEIMVTLGMPDGAIKLRRLMASHDGVLLACPEYNALPTPLLINAFDWLSCVNADTREGLPSGIDSTAGKPVGLLAASPGAWGGIRALPIVRTFLSTNFAMLVMPEQLALPSADKAFGEDGRLALPQMQLLLERTVNAVMQQARRHSAHHGSIRFG